jgi:hypothetical protein
MSSNFIDLQAPSLQGTGPKLPRDLPHGLMPPPERVRELLAGEKARHPPESFSPQTEQRLLNDWTLQYYFDRLGYEVLYRPTPEGPEVLAVGFDEIVALRKGLALEEQLRLQTWLPY